MEQEPRPCVTTLDAVLLMKIAMDSKDETMINSLLTTVLEYKTWTLPVYESFHHQRLDKRILGFLEACKEKFSKERYEQLKSYFQA